MAVKVGFVGAGGIANWHLGHLSKIEDADIVSLCDVKRERVEVTAKKYGGRIYTDYEKMLKEEKLDALYVCLPPFAHENVEILAAEKGYYRLMDAISLIGDLKPSASSTFDVKEWKQRCYNAMNDDFNTPVLIAHLFEAVKLVNLMKDGKETLTLKDLDDLNSTISEFVFDVLGLKNATNDGIDTVKLSGVVKILIELRNDARDNKDWALSDKIRDELIELGIQLKDGKDGTSFSLN